MPIFEYKCEDCGAVSEVLVRNTAKESEVVCPDCKSENLNKLISVPGALVTQTPRPEMPMPCPGAEQGCSQCSFPG